MGVIRDIEKGGGEIIRVEISEFRGKNYLNIRTWYTDRESGEYKPTQKGVSIRPDQYEELKAAILAAESELKKLDGWVRSEIAKVPQEKRRVITTHDAFGYFGDAYRIEFISALGVASMTEPSAEALARLVDRIRRENIRALFIENMSDPRMMETIARETGAEDGGTLYSDALSKPDGPAPTYVAMFRHNVPVLIAAMQKN